MEENIVACKVSEYTGRACIALKLNDREKAKRAARMTLVLYRLQSRAAINKLQEALETLRSTERAIKKAEENGITFPLGEQRINKLKTDVDAARSELVEVGRAVSVVLDLWQGFGATLKDLCNLCNRDFDQVAAEIREDRLGESFTALIFVYNLDYKDPSNRGWIDYDVDAPLTHAVKEHMLDVMLRTKEGREASHRALEECFPEIMENALHLVTDADGVKHLIDKDGVEVGTVGEG